METTRKEGLNIKDADIIQAMEEQEKERQATLDALNAKIKTAEGTLMDPAAYQAEQAAALDA